MDDYDLEDGPCPKCDHYELRSRSCTVLGCNDGWIDLFDEDPLWYDPDDFKRCGECKGTGIIRWCPNCGADLNNVDLPRESEWK